MHFFKKSKSNFCIYGLYTRQFEAKCHGACTCMICHIGDGDFSQSTKLLPSQ